MKEVLTLLKDHVQRESTLEALKTEVFLHEEVQGLKAFLANNKWDVDRLNTFISKAENQKQKLFNTSAKRSIQLRPWMKYAAVFVPLFLFGALFWSIYFSDIKPNNEQLLVKYKKYEPGLPVAMSMGSNKGFQEAMLHFKNEDYINAKAGFANIGEKENDTLNYFLGICNMELEAFQLAQNNFQKIPDTSVYFWKAQFNIILLYIEENDVKSAKKALKNYVKTVPLEEEKKKGKKLLNEAFFEE